MFPFTVDLGLLFTLTGPLTSFRTLNVKLRPSFELQSFSVLTYKDVMTSCLAGLSVLFFTNRSLLYRCFKILYTPL